MNITGGLVEEIVEGFNALHAECRLWRDRTLALRKLDGLPPEPGYEHCLDHSDELKFARVMARQRMTTDTSAAKEGQVAA